MSVGEIATRAANSAPCVQDVHVLLLAIHETLSHRNTQQCSSRAGNELDKFARPKAFPPPAFVPRMWSYFTWLLTKSFTIETMPRDKRLSSASTKRSTC